MKNLIRICLLLMVFCAVSAAVQAQEAIPEGKKKLIAELIVLTKADQLVGEITDKMLESMEKMYPVILAQSAGNMDELSAEDKKKMAESFETRFKSFSRKYREKLSQQIDYKQFVQDSIYPLYNKFYTEKELGDLVAFYKTETGQKVITSMPKLMEESNELSGKLLLPTILKLIDEIMKEEFPELNKMQSGPPPPAAPPPSKKPNK